MTKPTTTPRESAVTSDPREAPLSDVTAFSRKAEPCVVALDVGGTAMKGAVVDGSNTVRARKSYPTGADDELEVVLARIGSALEELAGLGEELGLAPPSAAGLAVPGIVDSENGIAVNAANLPFKDSPLVAPLEERLGIPVVLGHDVRSGGLAENVLGAAAGVRDAIFLPLGTGIAASLIVDGEPLIAGGYAGEVGHISVDPEGEPCPCGGRGCLERYASASAIARHYKLRSGTPVEGAAEVAALLRTGDKIAQEVWDEAIDALVKVLHTAVTLLGTEVVVIGGGLSESGDLLLVPLEERLLAKLTFQRRPRLVRAQLGDQAGCLGAALLAWRKVESAADLADLAGASAAASCDTEASGAGGEVR